MKEAASVRVAQRPDFEFRDPAQLTKVVSVLLILDAVASVFLAVSDGIKYALLASHAGFDQVVWGGIDALLILFQVALLFLTIIPFLMWVYRANWNAHALGAVGMRYRPGWAVGWYFIPIASLWMPYRVMREIWQGQRQSRRLAERAGLIPARLVVGLLPAQELHGRARL